MDEQGYLDQIESLTTERDEALADAASAGIDAGEIDSLRASNATAEEALSALREKVAESDKVRDLSNFTSKRDNAIKKLGLPGDHPAIRLAFPDETVLDDDKFASALGSLKEIAALSTLPPAPPPPLKLDEEAKDEARAEWDAFRAPGSGDGPPPSEATQAEKQTVAARAKYSETRNPSDLIGALGNKIMKIVSRKTPGGQKYYEKERVQ